jgi:membrane protease YdiL (CAAX protease family)
MNNQINGGNVNSKIVIKHSALGISAFVLSIFSSIFFVLFGIAANNNGTTGPLLLMFIICAIPSTVLSIVDLNQINRKKTLTIWALILNWGWIVLVLLGGLIFGGIYMFFKTKSTK